MKKQALEKMTFLRKNQAKNLINNKETLVLPKECTLPKKQDPWKWRKLLLFIYIYISYFYFIMSTRFNWIQSILFLKDDVAHLNL